jgi:hypothetical protein
MKEIRKNFKIDFKCAGTSSSGVLAPAGKTD